MMQDMLRWLGNRLFPGRKKPGREFRAPRVGVRPPSQRPGARPAASARRKPQSAPGMTPTHAYDADIGGRIEDGGPGKNVLVRSKYVREDSGTHEVLKIIDENLVEADFDDGGIDPYNTGRFDRSKNWSARYRK